ncbi:mitochondrial dicarboxylate/tricarboxylate transporter DTC-like [Arachis stenosperma]|uniref:mitochondrial dicarboxylate/tricarboxylate transporter DTC-like n=1 Tax=Arachis stenosperma TaxID=217475 RepID=UPI0025AC0712|nr:mitochondrial dicarboxylate/tricarboxylate transporter DTC-like [Arachis stenosperma]
MGNEKKRKNMDPVKTGLNMLSVSLLQPMDIIKVRMQLGQGSGAQIASNILKTEGGYAAFYRGLSAALLRLPLHKAVQAGSYSIIATTVTGDNDRKPLSLGQKVMVTSTALTIGWAFSIPTQLAEIRMQADATFPTSKRRNYTNVFNALHRVVADEGVRVLWRGSVPEIAKQYALTTGCFSGYPPSFRYLKDSLGFGVTTSMIGAGVISSFIGCALSLPFDYVRTQLQTMQPDAYGKYPYTGSFDCVRKTWKTGGLPMFYSGFHFYFFRFAALTTISWFITKQLRRLDASISEKKITIKAR